jgi:hypothetical protein
MTTVAVVVTDMIDEFSMPKRRPGIEFCDGTMYYSFQFKGDLKAQAKPELFIEAIKAAKAEFFRVYQKKES